MGSDPYALRQLVSTILDREFDIALNGLESLEGMPVTETAATDPLSRPNRPSSRPTREPGIRPA